MPDVKLHQKYISMMKSESIPSGFINKRKAISRQSAEPPSPPSPHIHLECFSLWSVVKEFSEYECQNKLFSFCWGEWPTYSTFSAGIGTNKVSSSHKQVSCCSLFVQCRSHFAKGNCSLILKFEVPCAKKEVVTSWLSPDRHSKSRYCAYFKKSDDDKNTFCLHTQLPRWSPSHSRHPLLAPQVTNRARPKGSSHPPRLLPGGSWAALAAFLRRCSHSVRQQWTGRSDGASHGTASGRYSHSSSSCCPTSWSEKHPRLIVALCLKENYFEATHTPEWKIY